MRRTILMSIVAVALGISGLLLLAGAAYADDGSGSGSAIVAAPTPADLIHDPLTSPAAAWDDIKAAKAIGWGIAVLAGLVVLARLAARLGGVFKWLGKGKAALVIGAGGAIAVTAYNALIYGGSWMAAALAAIVAAAAYLDSAAKQKPASP